MKRFEIVGIASLLVLTAPSSAWVAGAQEKQSEDLPGSRTEALRQSQSGGTNVLISPDEDYRIGRNDLIEVFVLKAPELSRAYKVNADGTIDMPFLGKINAEKKTSRELAKLIATGLRGE